MSKNIQKELSCAECSVQFGSPLAKFSTNFAFDLHLSTLHKKKNESKANARKKPFKCERCGCSFSTKQNLNIHLSSVHEGKKPFKCETCDRSFTVKRSMNKHVASMKCLKLTKK